MVLELVNPYKQPPKALFNPLIKDIPCKDVIF
jgi:hypothetical protein